MINVSKAWKNAIATGTDFVGKAQITLINGTVLDITDSDIVTDGIRISDSTTNGNTFQIGTAIINQSSLYLNNVEGKFSKYNFTDAVVVPYVGIKFESTIEWIKKGSFKINKPSQASSIVSLISLDNMNKFDTPFSEVTITYPIAALQLLQAVCLHCQVILATVDFLNKDFMIKRAISNEATTCREIVSYIAQLSGNFARCNINGALELKWYDFEVFEAESNLDGGTFDSATPYASGDNADGGDFTFSETTHYNGGTFLDMNRYHHIYSYTNPTIATDDIIITGVRVKAIGMDTDYGETSLFGSEGYVIEITTNPLIQENTAAIIANSVGQKIVGMKFRPCSVQAIADPSREAGDVAYLSDQDGNSYQVLLTDVPFSIDSTQKIACEAETVSENNSMKFDAAAKAVVQARKEIQHKLTAYDLAVQQLNNLVMHSFGVYHTSEKQSDNSVIEYSHDKPTLAESKNIWKQTADAFSVSNDGGKNWRGMDADGNMVVTVLNAIGINAEWINVGTLSGIRVEAKTGKIANMDIVENGLTLGNDETNNYFWIKVGNSDLTFYGGQINLSTMYDKNADPNQRQVTTLNLGNGGMNLTTNNYENTKGAGINVYDDSDGNPVLNIFARNENGLDDSNVVINGFAPMSMLASQSMQLTKVINFMINHFQYDPYA